MDATVQQKHEAIPGSLLGSHEVIRRLSEMLCIVAEKDFIEEKEAQGLSPATIARYRRRIEMYRRAPEPRT